MKRKRTVVKRVLQAIGKYKIWLAASLVLALLTVALTLYAPILVGDAIAHRAYERSKLYDPGFTTEYRKESGKKRWSYFIF